jgi:hypothetical protein
MLGITRQLKLNVIPEGGNQPNENGRIAALFFLFYRILQTSLRILRNKKNLRKQVFIGLRREGDSNPRSAVRRTTVFETAAFDHSAITPE